MITIQTLESSKYSLLAAKMCPSHFCRSRGISNFFESSQSRVMTWSSWVRVESLRVIGLQQWCTDMEISQSDWMQNFFINSISNPYPKI